LFLSIAHDGGRVALRHRVGHWSPVISVKLGPGHAAGDRLHATNATRWGIAASVLAAVLVAGGLVGVLRDQPDLQGSWTLASNLFFFGERIFLASVVSFAMVTCVRNYRAEVHNRVLNDHRSRSLRTFERLRAGASDERMKDAILLQATEAIFAMQASGFADGAIGVTHAHELLELVKPNAKG